MMTSNRPYLLRAYLEWICDNSLTPYVVIQADKQGVMVPQEHVSEDGTLILNITPEAVHMFQITNDAIEFKTRFGTQSHDIYAPIYSIKALYAKENGEGVMFGDDDAPPPKPTETKKPSLRIVK